MAENGSETLDATDKDFFESDKGVSTVVVICTSGVANIRVEDLTLPTEWVKVDPAINSGVATFRNGARGIKKITGTRNGVVDAEIDFYVAAINN